MLNLPMKLMTSCMAVANTIVPLLQMMTPKCPPGRLDRTGIAVKMENAASLVTMVKIAVRKQMHQWIAAKTANAANQAMMAKIATKHPNKSIN